MNACHAQASLSRQGFPHGLPHGTLGHNSEGHSEVRMITILMKMIIVLVKITVNLFPNDHNLSEMMIVM